MFFISLITIFISIPEKIPSQKFSVSEKLKVPSIGLQKYISQRKKNILYPFPRKYKIGSYGLTKTKLLRFGWEFYGKTGGKIRVADGGQVIFSGGIPGYGDSLLIQSDKNFIFFYSGSIESPFKVGDVVTRGSFLGKIQKDGIWVFAVFCKGWPINPEYLLNTDAW